MCLWDSFLRVWCSVALWNVQEFRVNNKCEAVSISGPELGATIT